MRIKKCKAIVLVPTVCLTLTILLAGCGSRGGTPAEDDSTLGISTMPAGDYTTSGISTTPDTITEPSAAGSDNTPVAPKDPVVLLPDPPNLNEEYLDRINSGLTINALGEVDAVDDMINEAYEKYGKYLNENISKLCIKLGLYEIKSISDDTTQITPEALKNVNDFLKGNDEEPLGTTDPKQRIAALWIAASLYFDPDYYDKDPYLDEEDKPWRHDIAMAFALAKYPSPSEIKNYADIYMSEPHKDIKSYRDIYASGYASLFNLWYH